MVDRNTIKGAKECRITKGENGAAQLDSCIDSEYWSEEKLDNTRGYTKTVSKAKNMDFERLCKRIDPMFEEGDSTCMTQSVNEIETEDAAPEKETKQGVTGYKFEQASKIREIEEVHDIEMVSRNEP